MVSNDNGNIVQFNGEETAEDRILPYANEMEPKVLLTNMLPVDWKDVIIIGRDLNGKLTWDSSSEEYAELNLMLDRVKRDLIELAETVEYTSEEDFEIPYELDD